MHKHYGAGAGKGGGTVIVPKHSELSAVGHDEATVTGDRGDRVGGLPEEVWLQLGLEGEGITARGHCRGKGAGVGIVSPSILGSHLFLLGEHRAHCVIPNLNPPVTPRPPTPGFQSWLFLL